MIAVAEPYWRGAAEDEAMQDEHGFLWRALLDSTDIDLEARRVLDAGCNRGGFLRLLVDDSGIVEGYGYDPASAAIDDARRLLPASVLSPHVRDSRHGAHRLARVRRRLQPRGPVPAPRHGVPRRGNLHGAEARGAVLRGDGGPRWQPPDVGMARAPSPATLRYPGCTTSTRWSRSLTVPASRNRSPGSKAGFVPIPATRRGHEHRRGLMDWLDYYERDKVLPRFTRPHWR